MENSCETDLEFVFNGYINSVHLVKYVNFEPCKIIITICKLQNLRSCIYFTKILQFRFAGLRLQLINIQDKIPYYVLITLISRSGLEPGVELEYKYTSLNNNRKSLHSQYVYSRQTSIYALSINLISLITRQSSLLQRPPLFRISLLNSDGTSSSACIFELNYRFFQVHFQLSTNRICYQKLE